jgi:hypothetical protein
LATFAVLMFRRPARISVITERGIPVSRATAALQFAFRPGEFRAPTHPFGNLTASPNAIATRADRARQIDHADDMVDPGVGPRLDSRRGTDLLVGLSPAADADRVVGQEPDHRLGPSFRDGQVQDPVSPVDPSNSMPNAAAGQQTKPNTKTARSIVRISPLPQVVESL